MSRHPRLELLLFILCFSTFAYFNQGGGWNQNSRFAEVRAMVEEGKFEIDDFLVYLRDPNKEEDLLRVPLENGEYSFEGKRYRLSWVDMEWNLQAVGDRELAPGVEKKAMLDVCSSGDIGYVPWNGHFHPNKPPGTSFLGVPGYFAIYHVEKWMGLNPDHWWTLEVNAWLTTVFSVGLISALGCVLFFRLACELSGGDVLASLLATVTFAFGTTFFPFGTIFFDHDLTAALLIASFYFLRAGRRAVSGLAHEGGGLRPDWCFALAGGCAGVAAITNYIAALAGFLLGLYALFGGIRRFQWRTAILFSLGVVPAFLLICWYGHQCFGSAFTLSTDFQNPLFKDDSGALFGMFPIPRTAADFWRLTYIFKLLTIWPMRGLFFVSPVLTLSIFGLFRWFKMKELRADALLCTGMFGAFFAVNLFFNGYHGGLSAGPRYLVPGLPFLALPLVAVFAVRRSALFRGLALLLAAVSIFSNLLLTATDAENPVGVGGHARVDTHAESNYDMIREYAWPLFFSGRAWPLLEEQIDLKVAQAMPQIEAKTDDLAERRRLVREYRKELLAGIARGDAQPLPLGSVAGPVSVNPIGVYEGLFDYQIFPPGSAPCRWASFNIGEFLWPESRWSLLPLLLLAGGLLTAMIRMAVRATLDPVVAECPSPEPAVA